MGGPGSRNRQPEGLILNEEGDRRPIVYSCVKKEKHREADRFYWVRIPVLFSLEENRDLQIRFN